MSILHAAGVGGIMVVGMVEGAVTTAITRAVAIIAYSIPVMKRRIAMIRDAPYQAAPMATCVMFMRMVQTPASLQRNVYP